jgi:hypothetical protein
MTDELVKIKDINSQAKKRLKQIELVEKHGTDKQAFLLAYELRKILPETEKIKTHKYIRQNQSTTENGGLNQILKRQTY